MIGAGALAIWMDIDPAADAAFNAWYRGQHLGERLSVPGFLRGRRYASAGDGPAYFTLYETADVGVLSSPPYLERLNAPTDWTRQALPAIRRMRRNVYRPLAVGGEDGPCGHLVTARLEPGPGRGEAVRDWLVKEGVSALGALGLVGGVGLYETDTSGTSVMTVERTLVSGDVSGATPYVALVELAEPGAAGAVREAWGRWAAGLGAQATVDLYRLMYGLAWLGA